MLKSDQGGIESEFFKTLVLLHMGWNQTKVGLKGGRFDSGCEGEDVVEIRPRWDWKDSSMNQIPWLLRLLKSDQGGIESPFSESMNSASLTVEIRPRWDWKEHREILIVEPELQLKSDQGGIESASTSALKSVKS